MNLKQTLALIILIMLSITLESNAQTEAKSHSRLPDFSKIDSYDRLLARAKSMDSTLDFFQLRMSFTKTKKYEPFKSSLDIIRKEMFDRFQKGDFKTAAEIGEKILNSNYCDIFTHLGLTKIYAKLKDPNNVRLHQFAFDGLVNSILRSGNGKTPETAWTVINNSEEFFILKYLGYTYVSKSLVNSDYGAVDVLTATKNNKKEDLHFNAAVMFDANAMDK